ELGVFSGTTVPRKTLGSGSRDGRDETGLHIDLAHAVIVGVGNVDVPVAIERQLAGIVEPRRRRWATIPCVSVKRSLCSCLLRTRQARVIPGLAGVPFASSAGVRPNHAN